MTGNVGPLIFKVLEMPTFEVVIKIFRYISIPD